jgi:TolB-like protein/tetratricopeptide (TPR) repeat protein
MVGYSRLIGLDDVGTLQRLRALRTNLIDPAIEEHGGRIVQTAGDSLLVVFDSIDGATRCAVKVQLQVPVLDGDQSADRAIRFRVGIDIGDAIADGTDLHGDAVNVAARLQAECPPGGVCVSRSVRDHVHGRLVLAFETLGPLHLKNIARPVEAFVVRLGVGSHADKPPAADAGEQALNNIARPVRVDRAQLASASVSPGPARAVLPLPDKPSIAVMPFQNMSADPEQEYFVDGIVEEITTAIARLPWLFVIARNSSFTYKGKPVDVKQATRELGVRYILEGSVRKAGNRVRITGQLIDTHTSAHIWADRFDGTLDDIFDLQDRVAASVVGTIEPRLRLSEIERASRKLPESLNAYDLYLRARAQFYRYSEEGFGEAITLLRQALAIDPSYAPAAALVGWCRWLGRTQGWGALSDSDISTTVRLCRQVLERERNDAETMVQAAFALANFAREVTFAATVINRAVALNQNAAIAWLLKGWLHANLSQPQPAIEAFNRAMRLSPLDPLSYLNAAGLAHAHLMAGRFGLAIEWANRALDDQPRLTYTMRARIVANAQLGRLDDARAELGRLLALQPGFTIAKYREIFALSAESADVSELFVAGLRLAGLPEE